MRDNKAFFDGRFFVETFSFRSNSIIAIMQSYYRIGFNAVAFSVPLEIDFIITVPARPRPRFQLVRELY
jgi:hypothetical protein